jgi:hypothetical protein
MEYASETVYHYTKPHPTSTAMARVVAFVLLVNCCRALIAWVGGTSTVPRLLLWVAFSSAPLVALWLRYGLLSFKFNARVVVSPSLLVARHWGLTLEYPWQDISSVTLETPGQMEPLQRFLFSLSFGRVKTPWAKIRLRRSLRLRMLVLWRDKAGTRILGVPIPWAKSIRLFLQEPEEFVRQTQQFLAPDLSAVPA